MNSKPLLCALPYVYGGMWLLWLSDSLAAALGFVLIMLVQPWLAWCCGKARDRRTLLVGNAVSFAASLVLVLLTGLCGIVDGAGALWQDHFKPLGAVEFVIAAAVVSLIVQAVAYKWAGIESGLRD